MRYCDFGMHERRHLLNYSLRVNYSWLLLKGIQTMIITSLFTPWTFPYPYRVYIQTSRVVRRLQTNLSLHRRARFTLSLNKEDLHFSDEIGHLVWKISTGNISQHFVGRNQLNNIFVTALLSDAKHIAFVIHETRIIQHTWDGLDREETDNWGEDNDHIEDEHILSWDDVQLWSTPARLRLSGVGSKSSIGLFRSSSFTSGSDSESSINR